MVDEDFVKEIYKNFDFNKMKERNQQMTEHIRKLLQNNPQQKYVFAVGSGYLFNSLFKLINFDCFFSSSIWQY
jgi:uncharacterized protein YbcC (UPF0753/DUF2309 family)